LFIFFTLLFGLKSMSVLRFRTMGGDGMVWWDCGGEVEEGHPPPLAGLCALDFFEKWGGCQTQSKKCGEILLAENTKESLR
jgi:hypothetical protein